MAFRFEHTPHTNQVVQAAAMRAVFGRSDLGEVKLVLAKLLPAGHWIYRGGSHIAVHERVPTNRKPDAGNCLLRILEAK